MNGQKPEETAARTGEMIAELAAVRTYAVELLAHLHRPPRSLRIQAGMITVDITWADGISARSSSGEERPVHTELSGETSNGAAGEYLTSPAVGVFYHAREPGAEPFVSVGSIVKPGRQVGIIEVMKLMIPVEADRAGIIMAVLKANGEPVQYGEPLFALEAGEALT
jgi:acetyl-CoA carboxylase biotin carboxyl carrier protein